MSCRCCVADACPLGWWLVGDTCARAQLHAATVREARLACAALGARLIKVVVDTEAGVTLVDDLSPMLDVRLEFDVHLQLMSCLHRSGSVCEGSVGVDLAGGGRCQRVAQGTGRAWIVVAHTIAQGRHGGLATSAQWISRHVREIRRITIARLGAKNNATKTGIKVEVADPL